LPADTVSSRPCSRKDGCIAKLKECTKPRERGQCGNGESLEFFVDLVALGLHASVQDAGDQNAIGVLTVEDHVLALLDSPQSWAKFVAGTAEGRIPGEPVAAIGDLGQIQVSLRRTPRTQCVLADA
jgi:hypothetical protein